MRKLRLFSVVVIGLLIWDNYFQGFADAYNSLEDRVLRLHILANSDSEADQNLKIKVRDRLLSETGLLFGGCSLSEAKALAESNIPRITELSQQVVASCGFDYKVTCSVGEFEFDERTYGEYTLPRGVYSAVQIKLGEANGNNWWCVLYPPLCLPCAEGDATEYFSEEELELMKNNDEYIIRFKLVEVVMDAAELAEAAYDKLRCELRDYFDEKGESHA